MITGYFDAVRNGVAFGWAYDTEMTQPVTVNLYCNHRCVGTGLANIFRAGLPDHGQYAFAIPLSPDADGEISAAANGTEIANKIDVPRLLRVYGPGVRRMLSENYITGTGIEIGPLDSPTWVPPNVTLRTVDRLPGAELRKLYGDDAVADRIREPDYICDAQTLDAVPDQSQDFLISNHVFEHMSNALLALHHWLRVLRPAGLLFMAIPDKRFTFDRDRPSTSLAHLLLEYHQPETVEEHRHKHVEEWALLVDHYREDSDVDRRVRFLIDTNYPIHWHAWEGQDLLALFAATTWLGFDLECFMNNEPEQVVLLRKRQQKNPAARRLVEG